MRDELYKNALKDEELQNVTGGTAAGTDKGCTPYVGAWVVLCQYATIFDGPSFEMDVLSKQYTEMPYPCYQLTGITPGSYYPYEIDVNGNRGWIPESAILYCAVTPVEALAALQG